MPSSSERPPTSSQGKELQEEMSSDSGAGKFIAAACRSGLFPSCPCPGHCLVLCPCPACCHRPWHGRCLWLCLDLCPSLENGRPWPSPSRACPGPSRAGETDCPGHCAGGTNRGPPRAATPSSPKGKRPANIDLVVTPNGPLLDQAAASHAIYELQRQFESIEAWANGVNANAAAHATHIDRQRDKIEGHRL